MRLIAFQDVGTTLVGAVENGAVHVIAPMYDFYASPEGWLSGGGAGRREFSSDDVTLVPITGLTAKVFCVGLNYRDHAAEAGVEVPEVPTVFGRWSSTLQIPGAPVPVLATERLDWEGELAVIVGATVRRATVDEARSAVLGFTLFNDLSARTYQLATSQWTLGKNADFSAPIGPELLTANEVPDYRALSIQTRVNGEVVQNTPCSEMIFSPEEIISYISGAMTLTPGDVIALGTPRGVGWVRNPPRFLEPGDLVEVEDPTIGVLQTPIVSARGPIIAATSSDNPATRSPHGDLIR